MSSLIKLDGAAGWTRNVVFVMAAGPFLRAINPPNRVPRGTVLGYFIAASLRVNASADYAADSAYELWTCPVPGNRKHPLLCLTAQ